MGRHRIPDTARNQFSKAHHQLAAWHTTFVDILVDSPYIGRLFVAEINPVGLNPGEMSSRVFLVSWKTDNIIPGRAVSINTRKLYLLAASTNVQHLLVGHLVFMVVDCDTALPADIENPISRRSAKYSARSSAPASRHSGWLIGTAEPTIIRSTFK